MKCSKKVLAFTLAATMMFGSVIGVMAAPPDDEFDTTDNKITFTSGGGLLPTDPVDPTDPDKEVSPDPDKEVPTGATGDLRLDLVPQFDFGSNQIVTGDKEFYAEVPTDTVTDKEMPYYVQVTDVRGSGAGWNVYAQMTTQFEDTAGHELTGAEIELLNTASAAQTGTTAPSGVYSDTLIPEGSAIKIASAAVDEGMGVSVVSFGADADEGAESVVLTIPASTQVYSNKYTTTIKWTMGATP